MYKEIMEEKIRKAEEAFERNIKGKDWEREKRVQHMERLLEPLKQLVPGRFYEIGNGDALLGITNADGFQLKLAGLFVNADFEVFTYYGIAIQMADGDPHYPAYLKKILESPFDSITIKRLPLKFYKPIKA